MKTAALPVSTLAMTAGLSADFHEVLTAASLPYPLLVAAARSCMDSLPLSLDKSVRIKAVHSFSRAVQCSWPGWVRDEAEGDVLLLNQAIAEAQAASLDPAVIVNMQLTMATMSVWSSGDSDVYCSSNNMQHMEILQPLYR